MYERGANGSSREIAIFIRQIGHQYQFYSISGGWANRTSASVSIYFPNFVSPEELAGICPYLPQDVVSKDLENKINRLRQSVSRDIAKPLLQKMAIFMKDAHATFLVASSAFDKIYDIFCIPHRFSHPTLLEIADRTFAGLLQRNENGEFPAPALYALHEFLMTGDERFRGADLSFRAEPQYELYPKKYATAVNAVVKTVRAYAAHPRLHGSEEVRTLEQFAANAGALIDLSRTHRQFTPHGSLGPVLDSAQAFDMTASANTVKIGPFGAQVIRFLEIWAGTNSFSRSSNLNGIGAIVLRAIKRYECVDLDQRTAWTCLKELGAIAPWATVAEYRLQVGREVTPSMPIPPSEGFIEDQMKTYRKDWKGLPVFCVDDVNAHEIDDGISIEETDNIGEFWVHTHIADPASHLDPKSPAAVFASNQTETSYLPHSVRPLLDSAFAMSNLSLQPDSPTLTFSAKMTLSGEILETNIEPGRVCNVIYITYDTFNRVGADYNPPPTEAHVIDSGSKSAADLAARPVISETQLSEKQKRAIKLLHQIAQARLEQQQGKGVANFNNTKPSVHATLQTTSERKNLHTKLDHVTYDWDPNIKLMVPESQEDLKISDPNAVACFMQVAGQVAAMWCHERRIPIPYRLTQQNPYSQDPREFFAKNLLPKIHNNERLSMDLLLQYFSLVGAAQVSTNPGPHISLGLDMYTRCTSPLRRFLDIVVHWQIQAALREENRSGASLVGNIREDFLPFSKLELDKLIDRAVRTEKRVKKYSRVAETEWMLQFLLRTWKFSKAGLPSPLVFTVSRVHEQTLKASGTIAPYLIPAVMKCPDWMEPKDMKAGDHFEVEIFDLDVHGIRLDLDAVRKMSSEEVKVAMAEWKASQDAREAEPVKAISSTAAWSLGRLGGEPRQPEEILW